MPARIEKKHTGRRLQPKPGPLRDKAYTRSAQHRHCMVRHPESGDFCNGEGVVCCHIRMAGNCGAATKPPDDESLFLCAGHHDEFDLRSGPCLSPGTARRMRMEWLVRNVYIPERKQAYRTWKMGAGR